MILCHCFYKPSAQNRTLQMILLAGGPASWWWQRLTGHPSTETKEKQRALPASTPTLPLFSSNGHSPSQQVEVSWKVDWRLSFCIHHGWVKALFKTHTHTEIKWNLTGKSSFISIVTDSLWGTIIHKENVYHPPETWGGLGVAGDDSCREQTWVWTLPSPFTGPSLSSFELQTLSLSSSSNSKTSAAS